MRIRLAFGDADTPWLKAQVRIAIQQAVKASGIEAPAMATGATMWEWFNGEDTQFWNGHNRRVLPLLVFDQFEEVFTLGRLGGRTEATQAFLDELVDLLRGRACQR